MSIANLGFSETASILENLVEGFCLIDSEWRITYINAAGERIAGMSRDCLLGKSHWEAFPTALGTIVEQKYRWAMANRTPIKFEHFYSPLGLWFESSASPVEGGGLLLSAYNITARKRAEEALRESEARFRTLAEASPALIWQTDPKGNNVYLNPRYQDLFGVPLEEIMGMGWQKLIHPDDAPEYLAAFEQAQRQRARYQRRMRVKSKDGGWRWLESHALPLFNAEGEYAGHVGISIDITDAAQAEEALKEADRRKDEFLATLAHELRNPLAPISNAVHLLRRPDGRRTADRIVEMVGRQVNHIVRLVDDLLEVSRITRGKIELAKAPVAVADIVAGAVEISKPVIDQAHHQLAVSLPEEPLILDADKVRLTQALANLLTNAAKYTNTGGKIWLSTWPEGGEAIISVRDSGIGIAHDQLPHIFNMFTQLHRVVGRGYGGLGIGLGMARDLVEMHGGKVTAHSAGPGQGSEFTIRLPLANMAGRDLIQNALPLATVTAPLSGHRILVVDDNQDAANSLSLLLEADGATVEIAYDGRSALASVEKFQPHAVLLDIGMPGMDGYEVAEAIRQDRRFDGIRLIALTGWGQQADRLRSQNSGFDFHLTKPVDYPALQKLLKGVIEES
jgi:PAS domain S-box-containing protein